MAVYNLKIADISIRLQIDWPVDTGNNFLPFLTDFPEEPMEDIKLSCVEQLPEPEEEPRWNPRGDGFAQISGENCIFHRLPGTLPFSAEIIHGAKRTILFRRASGELPYTLQKVFNGLPFEGLLLRHDAFILHSALVRRGNYGILFTAPSGTGKSTQAALWQQYMGAEILNGDRAALRKTEQGWKAWGLPVAGSSGIYRNESVPVSALVALQQGPENIIRRLTAAGALGKLYPETALFREDRKWVQQILDLLMDLLNTVPVWLLSCRPDREAVELLYRTLNNKVGKL